MKKWIRMFLALFALAAFSVACAGMPNKETGKKETEIKCPKCGSTFTVDEGLKTIKRP